MLQTVPTREELLEENRYLKRQLLIEREADSSIKIRIALGISAREQATLQVLYDASNRFVARGVIFEVIDSVAEDEATAVKVVIWNLRKKLGSHHVIETAPGQGYRLTALGRQKFERARADLEQENAA